MVAAGESSQHLIFVPGHFGEWFQGRLGARGPVVLVSVPCPAVGVFGERQESALLTLDQQPDVLSPDQLRRFQERLDLAPGAFRIRATMPPGGGAGASTAALVAIARAAGVDSAGLAAACLSVEGATDPLMLPRPDGVLWASREARVVRELSPPPEAEIVGGFYGPAVRTDPQDTVFPDVSEFLGAWIAARTLGDFAGIAAAAANACTDLRGPAGDPLARLARRTGALGHLRAHTGSARGLIFAPGTVPSGVEALLSRAGFGGVIRFRTGGPG